MIKGYDLTELAIKFELIRIHSLFKKNPMKAYLLIISLLTASFFSFGQPADSADFFLQKAISEKQAGRKLEVWKNLEKAYSYNPSDKLIVKEYASSLLDLRKYSAAREMFKKLEQMGESSAELYKQLFLLSYNTKQFDDAITYANKLVKADPGEKVSFYLGKIYYDRENYGEAIKHLQAAEKEDPQNAEAVYLIARCYADMSNNKLSIPYFEKAIALDPSKSYWIYELSLMYYSVHDDKNALKYMLLAAEKGLKKDNDFLENLGTAYLNAGNLEEGVKILKEILAKKPSDQNILNMIAEAYYYAGKYQEAIDYWDMVLRTDKTNAQSLYMIGLSYQKKGEKDKGIALCDKAIEMDPALSAYKQKKMNMGL